MLQWRPWRKAWSKANKGTTVSSAHRHFVTDKTKFAGNSIQVIPAGVDLNYSNQEKGRSNQTGISWKSRRAPGRNVSANDSSRIAVTRN